ncbi:hypothetical protein Pmani_020354 [Petrolisthes manimaculis]|uniref:Uncharacterized protein n=1 Tax=Petrolisthes manimaculis TaxID=1843537 RepID=A0AAE1PGT2_9EUCA|nr:hypothetical protein Pmani_020354 [Petrolisthes manimaculis]
MTISRRSQEDVSMWLNGDSSLDLSPLPGVSRLTISLPDLSDFEDLLDVNGDLMYGKSPVTSTSSGATFLTYPSSISIPLPSSRSGSDTAFDRRCSDLIDLGLQVCLNQDAESNSELEAIDAELRKNLHKYKKERNEIAKELSKMEKNAKKLQKENKKHGLDYQGYKKELNKIQEYLQKNEEKIRNMENYEIKYGMWKMGSEGGMSHEAQDIQILREGVMNLKLDIENKGKRNDKLKDDAGRLTDVGCGEGKIYKTKDKGTQIADQGDYSNVSETNPEFGIPSQTVEELDPKNNELSVTTKSRQTQTLSSRNANLMDNLLGDYVSLKRDDYENYLPSQNVTTSTCATERSVRPKTFPVKKVEKHNWELTKTEWIGEYVKLREGVEELYLDSKQMSTIVSGPSVRPKIRTKQQKEKVYTVTTTADVHCQYDGTQFKAPSVKTTTTPPPLPRMKRKHIPAEEILSQPHVVAELSNLAKAIQESSSGITKHKTYANIYKVSKLAEDEWEDVVSEGVFGAVGGSEIVSRPPQPSLVPERRNVISKSKLRSPRETIGTHPPPVKSKLHDYVNLGLGLLQSLQDSVVRESVTSRKQESSGLSDNQISRYCDRLDQILQEDEDVYIDMTPEDYYKDIYEDQLEQNLESVQPSNFKYFEDYIIPIDSLPEPVDTSPREKQNLGFRQKLKSRVGARKLQEKTKKEQKKRKKLSDMVDKNKVRTERLQKLTTLKMIETAALEKLAIQSKRQIMRLTALVKQSQVSTKELRSKLRKTRSQEMKLAAEHAFEQGRRWKHLVRHIKSSTSTKTTKQSPGRAESPNTGQRVPTPIKRYSHDQSPTKRHVQGLSPKITRLCEKREHFQNVSSRLSQAADPIHPTHPSTVRRRVTFSIPDDQTKSDDLPYTEHGPKLISKQKREKRSRRQWPQEEDASLSLLPHHQHHHHHQQGSTDSSQPPHTVSLDLNSNESSFGKMLFEDPQDTINRRLQAKKIFRKMIWVRAPEGEQSNEREGVKVGVLKRVSVQTPVAAAASGETYSDAHEGVPGRLIVPL